MNSIREGVRSGELRRDVHERLVCGDCGRPLQTDDGGRVGWRRSCPACGRTWKQLP